MKMNFDGAVDEVRKAGGGIVKDGQCNTWRVSANGYVAKLYGTDHVSGPDWKAIPDTQPATQSAPQPVLMTGYEAIAKAAREGGEVWHGLMNVFRISFDADGNILKTDSREIDPGSKIYTVRPLPPVDMSFDEALECLKRGESVMIQGWDNRIIPRLVNNIGSQFDIKSLKDKRFRKA